MPDVNLNNISTNSSGRTTISGISSGFDTNAIIEALLKVRQLPIDALDLKSAEIDSKISALSTLRSRLSALQTAVSILKNPKGANSAANNVFEYRQVFLTTDTGEAGNTYLGITANPGSSLGKTDFTVDNLAEKQQDRSITQTSQDTDLGLGDTSFSIIGLDTAVIDLDAGDTLIDVKNKINDSKSTTGVTASILKVSDTDYRLVLEHQDTGASNTFTYDFTGDPAVGVQFGFTTIQAAEDAEITVDGVTVERDTNVFSDVLSGVTISLYQESPGTTITVEIDENATVAQDAISVFADTYNSFRNFFANQTERDADGAPVEDAVLFRNDSLKYSASQLESEIIRAVAGIPTGSISSLGNIGLTLGDLDATDTDPLIGNILEVNGTSLADLLNSNFDDLRKIFELQVKSVGNKVTLYGSNNQLSETAFTVNVDYTQVDEDDIFQVTYGTTTVNAVYTPSVDKAYGDAISDDNPIFGATNQSEAFTGLTDGDGIDITITDRFGVQTVKTFTYNSSPSTITEFDSLLSLATAIETETGLEAEISNGQLVVYPTDAYSTVSFANNAGNVGPDDYVGEFGLADTSIIGGTFTIPDGNGFDDLTFIYTGDESDTVDVTITQGIADRLYNVLNEYLKDGGLLDQNVDQLLEEQNDIDEQVTRLTELKDKYRTQLDSQFSAMEAAIASAQRLLDFLQAQTNAALAASGR